MTWGPQDELVYWTVYIHDCAGYLYSLKVRSPVCCVQLVHEWDVDTHPACCFIRATSPAALGSGTGGGSAGYSTLSGGFGHSYGYNHNHSHSASMLGERDRGGRTGSKPHPGCVHCSKGFLRLELMCSPSILPFDIEADKAAAEKKAGSGRTPDEGG
jgi:hypothetical protein